jgi:peptide deformylase
MAVRPILRWPDPRLSSPARNVSDFGPELFALSLDVEDSLRDAQGLGLTASHLGVDLALAVITLPDQPALILVNPRYTPLDDQITRGPEGSLSMPGIQEEVERHACVALTYQSLDGSPHTIEVDGLLAVVAQHETDQVNGIFWLRRLTRLRRERALKRYSKTQ